MIEIGSVISARIERIEPYGLFLRSGDEDVFVTADNFTWRAGQNPVARMKPGDVVEVRVLRYNYELRTTVASLKHVHPERNPYRELSRLPPGTLLHAKVQYDNYDDGGLLVRLENDATGFIPKAKAPVGVSPGDEIDVVIFSLEVDSGDLRLEPAPR